ncbi:MAG: helix-turn-helix transcriptional regulator [Erysipelotrichaceae bacterium]|nr:helix-turn-helix transcriptional regulator [Erysipelotrichaceae bacterium]
MFSEKLRELREQSGMKQEELAKKMYLSRPVISKWERGLQYPNVEQLKQLSRIFHISMDELMDNTDFMTMPEVQPIMETKEETNLELLFFTDLLSLFVVKLMFDLTVKYNPKTFDWLMEDIVFLPVLAYATYKSYKKEASPKVIGYMFIYSMISFFIKRVCLNIKGVMDFGFYWIDFYYSILLNYSFPLIYSAVILLFYREEKEEKKKDRQNALLYWILTIMTAVYVMYYLFWYFIGFSSSMFGWNEHFIYSTVSTLTRCFITAFMIFEATKLRKKRIQARMSVSK